MLLLGFCSKSAKSMVSFAFYKKIAYFYSILFLSSAWSVIPQILEMIRMIQTFDAGSSYFDLRTWILSQALAFPNPFFLSYNITEFFNKMSPLLLLGVSLYLVLMILLLVNGLGKLNIILLILILIDIFLLNKGKGILDNDTIWLIFDTTPLNSLRSFDKTLIFLPYFLTISILSCLKLSSKNQRFLLNLLLLLCIISVYPFFTGEVQMKYSQVFDNNHPSGYSSLHIYPNEYVDFAQYSNSQSLGNKLIAMPYSVIDSIGWVNYPKWGIIGADPTIQLFEHPVIQMNSPQTIDKWNYGEYWNQCSIDNSEWLFPLLSMRNVKYIIYHNDVDDRFVLQTSAKMDYYAKNMYIKEIINNHYFTAYEINSSLFLPVFYTPEKIIFLNGNLQLFPEINHIRNYSIRSSIFTDDIDRKYMIDQLPSYERERTPAPNSTKSNFIYMKYIDTPAISKFTNVDLNSSSPILEFKKINPTKYRVRIHNATKPFLITFSESYYSSWRVYPKTYKKIINNEDIYKYYQTNNTQNIQDDPATIKNISEYMSGGWVTSIFEDGHNGFISKIIQGTIQNDNLPDGPFYETWLLKPINSSNHFLSNGYSNSWIINPLEINKDYNIFAKSNNEYDFEIIVELWPQSMFYIFLFVSCTTFLICATYVLFQAGLLAKRRRG
jgi:hypothetical protein